MSKMLGSPSLLVVTAFRRLQGSQIMWCLGYVVGNLFSSNGADSGPRECGVDHEPKVWIPRFHKCVVLTGFCLIQDMFFTHWTKALLDRNYLWIGLLPYLLSIPGYGFMLGSQGKTACDLGFFSPH